MTLWDKLLATDVLMLLFFTMTAFSPRSLRWAVWGVLGCAVVAILLVLWRVWFT